MTLTDIIRFSLRDNINFHEYHINIALILVSSRFVEAPQIVVEKLHVILQLPYAHYECKFPLQDYQPHDLASHRNSYSTEKPC